MRSWFSNPTCTRLVAAAVVLAVAPALFLGPAAAQWWPFDEPRGYRDRFEERRYHRVPVQPRRQRERRPRETVRASPPFVSKPESKPVPAPELKATSPQSPLLAVISIAGQAMTVYSDGGKVLSTPVSTGQPGHETPFGVFSIIQKRRYHESNIYSGAPMPFMQRITWSGIALHAGRLPGYPASHGCIRLPESVASRLFEMTRLGARVVIAPRDTEAVPFSHPALPVPRMTEPGERALVTASTTEGPIPVVVRSADPQSDTALARRLESPAARALAARTRAREQAKELKALVPIRVDEARRSAVAADALERSVASARARVDDLEDQHRARPALAASEVAIAREIEAREVGAERLADARMRLQAMMRSSEETTEASFRAAALVRETEDAAEAAEGQAKLAEKAINPVTLFVSRREGKVFARQGFEPVFEAPVTIEGSAPLGTHLFAALGANEGAGHLTWTAVSVPETERRKVQVVASARDRVTDADPDLPASSAAEALTRITFSAETRAWMEDRIWHGAALIVSDQGLGPETGLGTDFVVLTR